MTAQNQLVVTRNALLKKHFGSKDIDTVFHYTNLEATLNILKQKTLRFTEARYLNDSSELDEGMKILETLVPQMITKLSIAKLQDAAALFAALLAFLKISLSLRCHNETVKEEMFNLGYRNIEEDVFPIFDIYVASFSTQGDNLSQWLAYSDYGKGCAIGFPAEAPEQVFQIPDNYQLFSSQVNYSSFEKKKNFAEEFLEEVCKSLTANYTKDFPIENEDVVKAWWSWLTEICILDILTCKYSSFYHECEARVVCLIPDKLSYEVDFIGKNNLIKPYVEFAFRPDKVTKLLLGPLLMSPINKHAMNLLLKSNGINNCLVDFSQISFRG